MHAALSMSTAWGMAISDRRPIQYRGPSSGDGVKARPEVVWSQPTLTAHGC